LLLEIPNSSRLISTDVLQKVLNRFSRGKPFLLTGLVVTGGGAQSSVCLDIYVIDELLARTFGGFFRTVASVVGVVVVISGTAPVFLIMAIVFVFSHLSSCLPFDHVVLTLLLRVTSLFFIYKRIQSCE
jgi:hypothetical protein